MQAPPPDPDAVIRKASPRREELPTPLAPFTRLRDAPRIELEVERDGQVQQLTYTVRG